MTFLVEKEEVREYRINDHCIRLQMDPLVFAPSIFGLQFASLLDLRAGERVADIGTGTGIHAILAGRCGARQVVATDTFSRALEITAHNAALNGLQQVETRRGSFFAGAEGAFDAIVANLPQEIIPPDYLAGLQQEQATGVDGGGAGGNALLLEFLALAPAHMHQASRLYIIVNTVTDFRGTLALIESLYSPRVLWEGAAPAKDFVTSALGWYQELMDRGIVDLFVNDVGQWCARQWVYELMVR